MKTITQTNKLFALFALAALMMAVIVPFGAYAAAHVTTIYGNTSAGENQPGWLFNRDTTTDTPFEFTTAKASIGDGSVYVLPISNLQDDNVTPEPKDKFIAELFPAGRLAVLELKSFSYDFLIGANGTASDENEFYLNVYANFGESDDTKFFDCRYNVVPTTGSTNNWTTVTFDPTMSYTVTTRNTSPYICPAIPADMDLLSTSTETTTIRMMALNVGDTSVNDQNLDGYFDNVILTTTAGETIYDFEVFDRTATITAPTAGEEVVGVVNFAATLNDKDGNDNVQWAVRAGSCSGTTVAGNVDTFSNTFSWDGADFSASVDMTTLAAGAYCFVFNPTESLGDEAIRLTQNFTLAEAVVEPPAPTNPVNKNECKKGGYEDFGFKNQGQCVRFVETGKDSR